MWIINSTVKFVLFPPTAPVFITSYFLTFSQLSFLFSILHNDNNKKITDHTRFDSIEQSLDCQLYLSIFSSMRKLLETSLLSHLPFLPWPTHYDKPAFHGPEEEHQKQQQFLHGWEAVAGLCESQRRALNSLSSHGVLWKHPSRPTSHLFHLSHGGDVGADRNCLFSTAIRALGLKGSPADLRRRVVRRFVADYGSKSSFPREETDLAIRNLYRPDLELGWGVHFIQEVKVLALKKDRSMLDSSIIDLVGDGVSREAAAERVYKEKCLKVDSGETWAKYMSISGDIAGDEYDIVSLHYTEEGLLSIEENRAGKAAAFGDDVAIEALATEFQREVYVVMI